MSDSVSANFRKTRKKRLRLIRPGRNRQCGATSVVSSASEERSGPIPLMSLFGDLQRELLIDRGPSSVPKNGIPYLSKEGFPYRVFEKAHPELVTAAKKLKIDDAIQIILKATKTFPPKKNRVDVQTVFHHSRASGHRERSLRCGL